MKAKARDSVRGLVLTFRLGESVIINHQGEDMVVGFTEVQGRQVRLAFNAPKTFAITRVKRLSGQGETQNEKDPSTCAPTDPD